MPERVRRTVNKSRANPRPALASYHREEAAFIKEWPHLGSFLGTVMYVAAALILVQFLSMQFAISSQVRAFSNVEATEVPSMRLTKVAGVAPTITKPGVAKTETVSGLPLELRIPKLKVQAAIRPVGLAADGSMGIPTLPRETAWYQYGAKPGEPGSAAIAGHVDWWRGQKGVFQHLKTLKKGDKIVVQNDKGELVTFEVKKTKLFSKNENATEVFISTDGKAHLNLITCAGVWDRALQVYTKRYVVFAEKVEE